MDTNLSFTHAIPTTILFGAGKLHELSNQPLPGKKALIVISNGKSTRDNGYLARVEEQLDKAGIGHVVYDGIQANPTTSNVRDGAAAARRERCDCILALGGGSVIDAAKAIATMAVNDGEIWDYVLFGTGKKLPVRNKPLPLIAITTTAGTGSEADNGAVITNEVTHEKCGFFAGMDSFPTLSIVDPELMVSVPATFTAYQGFDALFHSVEGYVSTGTNLMSDMFALTAIENIAKYLPRAVADGNDMEARTHVAFGNTLSGFVMCVGACTSEHSLEHALSAYHENLPHGAGLIMISRAYYSLLIKRKVVPERFIRMAQTMGMVDADKPEDFIVALTGLQKACGVDTLRMSDYGITPNEFPIMVENARETMGFLFDCDRVELSSDDCVAIYQASFA
ncbi:MAG: iron-containing alcohol dehydrogenase [Planctomycetes bacterium]|nr:iron-containing alcohol dehydrogenase [Planctomycetota bacterium]